MRNLSLIANQPRFEPAGWLNSTPVNLNVQVANFLPQRVAVEAQKVGRANLVAPRRRQSRREQGYFDFLEYAVIEPGRRHAVRKAGKMRRQIGLDRAAEIIDPVVSASTRRHGRRG